MATATIARPSQALRSRRDAATRPGIIKRNSVMDASMEPAAKKRKLDEPYVRTSDYILRKHRGKPASFAIHLHQTYFRFGDQDGSYGYDSPMKSVIQHMRRQTVPHEMMVEFLSNHIPFYDGCLIVEVHNHRSANGKDRGRNDSATGGDGVKFSMNNYHSYITPSPLVPYPVKAKNAAAAEKTEPTDTSAAEQAEKDKSKGKDGPHVTTLVLHPTPQSQLAEMLILANTPASEMRSKKKGPDAATPSITQPPTPQLQLSLPSLNTSGGQKMCLEDSDFYQFQADLLIATEPPLYLDPVDNPQAAQKVLDLLAHPLHSDAPPSPKTRKRTTAEMAADDAQAAEAERRMLIMDERIKPSARTGAGANVGESQGTAASLGFSRFKSIQIAKERVEERERLKKEEEAQAALLRRQQEEASNAQAQAAAQQAQQAQQNREKLEQQQRAKMLMQQRQRQAMEIQNQRLQSQMAAAQNHGHPQQNMMPNQAAGFQHPSSMAQSSPVVRQQTPMMNSSPMLGQNGFPMTATSSQGAGSPSRPPSAVMPNSNVAMARQASQQHGSRNNTPQLAQGTPHMPGQVMPNRQMAQTPRMSHGGKAPGTPASANMPLMPMNTPQQNNMTPIQMAMLQTQQQAMQQGNAMSAGSPGPQNGMQAMTPEMIQNMQQQQQARQAAMMRQQMAQQAQAQNPHAVALMQQRQAMLKNRQQQAMAQQQQQRMMQQNANGAGSPHPGMQGNPQMGHGHPMQPGQQMTPQQNAVRQNQMNQIMQSLMNAAVPYGGDLANIPPHIVASLPPAAQHVLRTSIQRNATARAQKMALNAQQAQNTGHAVAGNSGGDPEYMATLRNQQNLLAQRAQAGQMGMNMGARGMNPQQQFGGQGQQANELQRSFVAMQNALNTNNQQGGGMG